jgi:hypothetical protein
MSHENDTKYQVKLLQHPGPILGLEKLLTPFPLAFAQLTSRMGCALLKPNPSSTSLIRNRSPVNNITHQFQEKTLGEKLPKYVCPHSIHYWVI